ncbi:metalloproteinase inhibitor 2 isoform X1 [Apis cerana]|nr:metalloproteinase inhibitor 2 isoform X1 [Apis cerana]
MFPSFSFIMQIHMYIDMLMWRLRFWIYVLVVAISLAQVRRVVACSCMNSHPQTLFCNSDFVILVRVKKMTNVNEFETAYNVKVNKFFKANKTTYPALRKNILWTASSDSMCGAQLKVGETYVVSGRVIYGDKAHISSCGIAMPWRFVTSRQRKGFRHLYHSSCMCKVRYTPWWIKGITLENTDGTECLWETRPGPEECQKDFGICMYRESGCYWTPSVPYKNCIKKYQLEREQKRAREP